MVAENGAGVNWRGAVIDSLAKDLRRAFPGVGGFSALNLRDTKRFYAEYANPQFGDKLSPNCTTNPIGVAEYQLTGRLPNELQGKSPSALELSAAVLPAKTRANDTQLDPTQLACVVNPMVG